MAKHCKSVSEEIATCVFKFKEMVFKGELLLSSINGNDCVTKYSSTTCTVGVGRSTTASNVQLV